MVEVIPVRADGFDDEQLRLLLVVVASDLDDRDGLVYLPLQLQFPVVDHGRPLVIRNHWRPYPPEFAEWQPLPLDLVIRLDDDWYRVRVRVDLSQYD